MMFFSRLYHVRFLGALVHFEVLFVLFCFILASDTQSSFSDYTSLSNDDHEGRYDHDAAAGIIFLVLFLPFSFSSFS